MAAAISPAVLLPALAAAAGLLAAAGTAAALAYARRGGPMDQPGRRRSHAVATPRGGGVGPVLAWLLLLPAVALLPAGAAHPAALVALAGGTLLVALVGAIDDHRPLPAWPRLLVHVLASVWLVLSVRGWPDGAAAGVHVAVLALAVVALLNFWNFMDGIDGLAAVQTAFVAAFLGAASVAAGNPALGGVALLLAAAVLGFLPFNLPLRRGRRARIFLGDVGSGALGFAVGGLLLLGWSQATVAGAVVLLLPSAFLLDAGLTLAWRMLRKRRWYTAHREHLYQWLVRRQLPNGNLPHARVVAYFLAWNLLIVTPLATAVLVHRFPDLAAVVACYAAGALLWLAARRALVVRRRATVAAR